jgi:hypothetical protein
MYRTVALVYFERLREHGPRLALRPRCPRRLSPCYRPPVHSQEVVQPTGGQRSDCSRPRAVDAVPVAAAAQGRAFSGSHISHRVFHRCRLRQPALLRGHASSPRLLKPLLPFALALVTALAMLLGALRCAASVSNYGASLAIWATVSSLRIPPGTVVCVGKEWQDSRYRRSRASPHVRGTPHCRTAGTGFTRLSFCPAEWF